MGNEKGACKTSIEVTDIRKWLDCSSEAGYRVWDKSGLYGKLRTWLARKTCGMLEAGAGQQSIAFNQACGYAEEVINNLHVRMKERAKVFMLTPQALARLESHVEPKVISQLRKLPRKRDPDEESFLRTLISVLKEQPMDVLCPIVQCARLDFAESCLFEGYVFKATLQHVKTYLEKQGSPNREQYRLTDESFADMATEIPPVVVEKLNPLKDESFKDRSSFLKSVAELIGEDGKSYSSFIVYCASVEAGPKVSPRSRSDGYPECDAERDEDSTESDEDGEGMFGYDPLDAILEKEERDLLKERTIRLNGYAQDLIEAFQTWLGTGRTKERKILLEERYSLGGDYKALSLIIFLEQNEEHGFYDEIMEAYKGYYCGSGMPRGTFDNHNHRLREKWKEFSGGVGRRPYNTWLNARMEMRHTELEGLL